MAYFNAATVLAPLDHLAISILDTGDAMLRAQSGGSTLKVDDKGLRCVAVADANGTLLIAANNLFVTREMLKPDKLKGGAAKALKNSSRWGSIRKSVNRGDAIADNLAGLLDIMSDTSADARERFGFDRAIFVTGIHAYMNNYHAEMQILQFMLDYKIKPASRYMGVSKPCCVECASILTQAEFTFAEGSTSNVAAVRNVLSSGFAHPHTTSDLAIRLGAPLRSRTGAHEAPF